MTKATLHQYVYLSHDSMSFIRKMSKFLRSVGKGADASTFKRLVHFLSCTSNVDNAFSCNSA